ncbi:hypothetical protein [Desulfobacter latus]|uniref:Uncharacterized protein n=1 Tax=Desulfobacter latus TaxID=2292 RepID=A0A850SYN7_9BACT|nr:hypothetical protein [Desulfobacter latus]NWH03821.1 hypothetical protein [Desulfobacter latus]
MPALITNMVGTCLFWVIVLPMPAYAGGGKLSDGLPKTGGGPCEYAAYKGKAKIISVKEIDRPQNYGGGSHKRYAVKFVFSTQEKLTPPHFRVTQRVFDMKLANGWHLGPEFLDKYGIRENVIFDCIVKTVTKGPCTPVVFDFPKIHLDDYFENRKPERG